MNAMEAGHYQIRRRRNEIMANVQSGDQSSFQDACRAACIEFERDLAKLNKQTEIRLKIGFEDTTVNVSRLEGMTCYASVLHNNRYNKVTLDSQCGLFLMASLSEITSRLDDLVDFTTFEAKNFIDTPSNSHFSFRDCEYSGQSFHNIDQYISYV